MRATPAARRNSPPTAWRYSSIGTPLRPGQRFSAPSASTQSGVRSYSARTISDAACAKGLRPPGASISSRWPANHAPGSPVSSLLGSELAIALRRCSGDTSAIASPNALSPAKGGSVLPALRQAAQATQRERLHHRLLEPLARRRRLGVRLPTIGHDMAQLMAELIGELRPGLLDQCRR